MGVKGRIKSYVKRRFKPHPLIFTQVFIDLYVFHAVGDNVKEFFFRVASLAFETNVLAELEKSGSRQIGDVVSEYLSGIMKKQSHLSHSLKTPADHLFQELTAIQTIRAPHPRRNSQTAVSKDGGGSFESRLKMRNFSRWKKDCGCFPVVKA